MNTIRLLLPVFFMFAQSQAFSQSSYDVFFLGEHEDSIALDPSLHWYLSAFKKDTQNFERQQFVPIDLKKDLVYVSDTDRYSIYLDTALHLRGFMLIGTKDSLSTYAYIDYDYDKSFVLRIGDDRTLFQQYFRDCSPYVNLMVTGTVRSNHFYQTVENYKLKVGCYFTEYAYHKRYSEENYKSFTQDINKLVHPDVNMKKVSQTALILKAYIDDDEYYDLVLGIKDVYFLLLSKDYDLGKKKLYHIEKTWRDTRIMEF
jgi:hypothetical protein